MISFLSVQSFSLFCHEKAVIPRNFSYTFSITNRQSMIPKIYDDDAKL